MLSKRLKTILGLIPKNSTLLVDVGTDHAWLPIVAIREKLVTKAYAVDVNHEPLIRAQQNIQRAQLTNKIVPILADGLDFLNTIEEFEVDCCVIAGLGTKTILDILSKDSPRITNYIVAANTEIKSLRHWANTKKYQIAFEGFLVEDDHHYWVVWITKQNFQECKNVEFGDFSWHQKNRDYQEYLENLAKYNQKVLQQLKETKNKQVYQAFSEKNKRITEYLKQWN